MSRPPFDQLNDCLEPLIRLLSAVSEECSVLTGDIVRLGDILSEKAARDGVLTMIGDLQNFDVLGQRAGAQAALLSKIAHALADELGHRSPDLDAFIGKVPFHGVRERLSAALAGHNPQAEKPKPADDSVDWF